MLSPHKNGNVLKNQALALFLTGFSCKSILDRKEGQSK